jgi:hypothetical protein
VLTWRIRFSGRRLIFLNKSFVFDPKILELILPFLQLNGNFMAFLFR